MEAFGGAEPCDSFTIPYSSTAVSMFFIVLFRLLLQYIRGFHQTAVVVRAAIRRSARL